MDRVLALDAAYPLPLLPAMLDKFPKALAGAAALAAAFIGSGEAGAWASGIAVLCGALAAAVNTVEHGGQVGMVFKLCRNVAGIYRKIQEDIEANLKEADVERRENGEVFETKVALQLGRSTSELKQFRAIASPAVKDEDIKEFAGALGKEDRAEPESVPPPWWWSQYSTTRARAAPLTTSGRLTTTSSSPPPPRPSSSILLIVPDAAVITFDEDGAGAAGKLREKSVDYFYRFGYAWGFMLAVGWCQD
ncbi:hypothetical protein OsJ_17034 [Oryza sativa Japonica Group]|uniref:Uncharacterized protein n=1 Tax=Oryza sativa subsp. japonica TaxID=39947 RepID=B9FMB8_ORYSJ|nr:hypothetical protein OsJ_17034 [Oryza sativa Japonica Group]